MQDCFQIFLTSVIKCSSLSRSQEAFNSKRLLHVCHASLFWKYAQTLLNWPIRRSKSSCTLSLLQALQLLNFLIVDCSDNLCEAIGCLDPFPDTAKFKQINKRYKQIRKDRTSLREVFIGIYTVSTLLTIVK